MSTNNLPIYSSLPQIAQSLCQNMITILNATPGSGKTSLLPYFLVKEGIFSGKILMLESRRITARAAAQRISWHLNEPIGKKVGLRTRDETICSVDTIIEIMTEAVLLRILQNDPSLKGVSLIIFDEFHERTVNADLALSLIRESISLFNPTLKILIMSATLTFEDITASLPEAYYIQVEGNQYPVEIEYRPPQKNESLQSQICNAAKSLVLLSKGDILVFLPGLTEIRKTEDALRKFLPHIEIESIHGSYSISSQRSVIEKKGYQRIVLATNIAETSLTIDGIEAVIDSGIEKRSRYNPATAMEHLDTLQITKESAEQRAGRAGRTAKGVCIRLWNHTDVLIKKRPNILSSDLVPLVMECLLWGTHPDKMKWITNPPQPMITKALEVLQNLLMCKGQTLTKLGTKAALLSTHPRLSRMIILAENEEKSLAILLAGIMSEQQIPSGDLIETCIKITNDGFSLSLQKSINRIARENKIKFRQPETQMIRNKTGAHLYNAYPERVALYAGQNRYILSSGRAARTTETCNSKFIIACIIDGGTDEGLIRSYTPINYDVLVQLVGNPQKYTHIVWTGWKYHLHTKTVLAGIVLSTAKGGIPDKKALHKSAIVKIKSEGFDSLPWDNNHDQSSVTLYKRILFYTNNEYKTNLFSKVKLIDEAEIWLQPFFSTSNNEIITPQILLQALLYRLGYEKLNDFEMKVPSHFILPSGRKIQIDYSSDRPVIAGRIQEFFGTQLIAPICGVQPLIHLLSPANRPVQITEDINGFWKGSYLAIRKELAGRYPKHHWPDDPLSAEASQHAKRKKF